MTDLIERLRDCAKVTFSAGLHGVGADCKEAASILALQYDAEATRAVEAAEMRQTIERLQSELAGAKQQLAVAPSYAKMIAHHGRQEKEIERLRGDYQFQRANADRVIELHSQLESNLTRLHQFVRSQWERIPAVPRAQPGSYERGYQNGMADILRGVEQALAATQSDAAAEQK